MSSTHVRSSILTTAKLSRLQKQQSQVQIFKQYTLKIQLDARTFIRIITFHGDGVGAY